MIPGHLGRRIAIAMLILVAATFAGTATATGSGQTEQPETVVVISPHSPLDPHSFPARAEKNDHKVRGKAERFAVIHTAIGLD